MLKTVELILDIVRKLISSKSFFSEFQKMIKLGTAFSSTLEWAIILFPVNENMPNEIQKNDHHVQRGNLASFFLSVKRFTRDWMFCCSFRAC